MTEVFAFLLGLSFWPIAILVFFSVLDTVCLSTDRWWWGTFWTLIGAALFVWTANVSVWPINWKSAVLYAGAYLAIGMAWSVARWYLFLIKKRNRLLAKRAKMSETEFKESRPNQWDIPTAAYHKARIISWIAHWPFSMLATLFGDWLAELFSAIYEMLSGLYENIAKSVFKDFRIEK